MEKDFMQNLAKTIDEKIHHGIGMNIGFCLLVFPLNNPGISNYVSNASRQDMIKVLRETADRLERNEDNPREG